LTIGEGLVSALPWPLSVELAGKRRSRAHLQPPVDSIGLLCGLVSLNAGRTGLSALGGALERTEPFVPELLTRLISCSAHILMTANPFGYASWSGHPMNRGNRRTEVSREWGTSNMGNENDWPRSRRKHAMWLSPSRMNRRARRLGRVTTPTPACRFAPCFVASGNSSTKT
jgi:hypothetical protein